jgi:hypothetical protein
MRRMGSNERYFIVVTGQISFSPNFPIVATDLGTDGGLSHCSLRKAAYQYPKAKLD